MGWMAQDNIKDTHSTLGPDDFPSDNRADVVVPHQVPTSCWDGNE